MQTQTETIFPPCYLLHPQEDIVKEPPSYVKHLIHTYFEEIFTDIFQGEYWSCRYFSLLYNKYRKPILPIAVYSYNEKREG